MLTPFEIIIAGLGATYLNSRWLLKDDLRVISYIARDGVSAAYQQYIGHSSYWYLFEKQVINYPNKLALVYARPEGDSFVIERYTFKQFYDICLKYAYVLRHDYGLKSGDRCAMDFTNKPEFLFLWFGMWSLGVIPAFINFNLRENSLVHCVKVVTPKLFIFDEEIADGIQDVLPTIRQNGTGTLLWSRHQQLAVEKAPIFLAPDSDRCPRNGWDEAMYVYTSGTSGLPKAAKISWQKCTVGGTSYARVMKFRPDDIEYTSMPLYHSTASIVCVLSCYAVGSACAIGHKFSTSTFWTQVKLCDATIIQYVGETCRYLLNAPHHPDERAHRVRMANGNGLRPDIWQKFKERFNIPVIGEFFASTESPTALTNVQSGEFGVGSVGRYGSLITRAIKHIRYRLAAVDPDNPDELYRDPKTGLGREPKVNEPGEIVFKLGDPKEWRKTFQGYTDDKASLKKIALDLFKKGDGWVRNGDLLRQDEEGFYYFVDRMGDTFRWKSENVSTNEVEHVITDVPGVELVVVVGVQVPNHEGRAGLAVIKPTDINNPPKLSDISEHLIKELPLYAVPIFLKFVDNIETTGNNKIQKVKYRNQKLPSDEETIYVLTGKEYKPLTNKIWASIVGGQVKL